ncbi:MAG: hypothetical protein RIR00_1038 [Pseudomonadota bacterium]|jgi:TolC family type I secretion outer membrane protein
MKAVWRLLLILAGLGATGAPAGELGDLYRQALLQDPGVLSSQAETAALREEIRQARGAWLPQVNLAGSRYRNDAQVTTTGVAGTTTQPQEYRSFAHRLVARQALYRPAVGAQMAQAEARAEGGEYQVRLDAIDLVNRLVEAYFDVLQLGEEVFVEEKRQRLARERLEQAQVALRQGEGSKLDIAQARADFHAVQTRTLDVRLQLANARENLVALVGTDVPAPRPLFLRLDTPIPGFGVELEEWLQSALVQHPKILIQQQGFEVAEKEVDKARSGHLPTLDAVASRTHSGNETLSTLNTRYATNAIGLEYNIPIFAGGSTDAAVQAARHRLEKSRLQLEKSRREVGQMLRKAFYGYRSALGQYGAAQSAAIAARENLQAGRMGLQHGLRSRGEVAQVELRYLDAELELAKAFLTAFRQRVALYAAHGSLDAEVLDALDGELRAHLSGPLLKP